MKTNFKLFLITVITAITFAGAGFSQITSTVPATTRQIALSQYQLANPLDMVAYPAKYLNRFVTVRGRFDKFSTLGLDYTPAKRSSEDYISFLIQRDDIKDHNIPLSEMKIFLKRAEAEKHIDLNSGDEIEFSGKVFSNALGDVWMDADKFTVIEKKEQPKK